MSSPKSGRQAPKVRSIANEDLDRAECRGTTDEVEGLGNVARARPQRDRDPVRLRHPPRQGENKRFAGKQPGKQDGARDRIHHEQEKDLQRRLRVQRACEVLAGTGLQGGAGYEYHETPLGNGDRRAADHVQRHDGAGDEDEAHNGDDGRNATTQQGEKQGGRGN